ncbi:NADP-dependent oxidoreductase [Longimicrobium sp.]|uniref:quinone oxidoreductase family protein n=1 Tax=Longimicrobium sp. TaxID=2029185 RepID=UPI002E3794D1|nr:NADP-dependent oxidoreductase [Longimicrobium sp.]HEX6037068.1 NADP-dependent oxidoreductase [Longimicrobium sp.]
MTERTPDSMRAIAIDQFGGIDALRLQTVPVPEIGPDEVLVRVEYAGVGEWDPFEREGGYAQMLGMEPAFPYVLGSEGAGTVAAVGADVRGFAPGDRVYAIGFLNPKGGFYAEYAAVHTDFVSPLPRALTTEQAAVVGGVGLTALRGLDDVLRIRPGGSVLVLGAGGGIGHVAVQLARQMHARVFAVASGADGVALATHVGADAAVDGRVDDVLAAARAFAPEGMDAALLTAGGAAAETALHTLREGGRAAYPNGVQPRPAAPAGVRLDAFNGDPDRDIVDRLDQRIASGRFDVHVARTFPLEQAADAHRALGEHYLGKLALRIG